MFRSRACRAVESPANIWTKTCLFFHQQAPQPPLLPTTPTRPLSAATRPAYIRNAHVAHLIFPVFLSTCTCTSWTNTLYLGVRPTFAVILVPRKRQRKSRASLHASSTLTIYTFPTCLSDPEAPATRPPSPAASFSQPLRLLSRAGIATPIQQLPKMAIFPLRGRMSIRD